MSHLSNTIDTSTSTQQVQEPHVHENAGNGSRNIINSRGILRDLGIVGWDHQEPAILAALATKTPLVLIGAHGTAKSLLLQRLAEALDLNFRHYNASILNFDDLIGFPIPKGDYIEYLRTPLDAWDAEAIFIDEISRCRVDMQNRLFPLIHERKLQGKSLEKLQYCWSAMNPSTNDYIGTSSLDVAFADRYHWLVHVPTKMNVEDECAIISGISPKRDAGESLHRIIASIRGQIQTIHVAFGHTLPAFLQSLRSILENAGFPFSLRRAHIIYQNTLSLLATGRFTEISQAVHIALQYSLPQNVHSEAPINAITKAIKLSSEFLKFSIDPVLKALLTERDILKRIAICLKTKEEDLITATILDAHASLEFGERLALSYQLFPILVENHPDLPTLIFENLSYDMEKLQSLNRKVELVPTYAPKYKLVDRISKATQTLEEGEEWIEDVVWTAFQYEKLNSIHSLIEFSRRVHTSLVKEVRHG